MLNQSVLRRHSQRSLLPQKTCLSILLLSFSVGLASVRPTPLNAQAAAATSSSADDLMNRAQEAQKKAVKFFHEQVAVEGGYVYQVTSDLKLREGEGDAGQKAVWTQPPGTPAVGLALIEAFERTGDDYMLQAAKDAGHCLVRGQLHSGGWQNHIDFDPELRGKLAYRVDGQPRKKARNISSFDDDQTQSALRFLMKLDRALKFSDAVIHESTEFGLAAVLRNQFPNGAWSQVFEKSDPSVEHPKLKGTYPETWPREYPGGDYWFFYTLNDQALVRVMDTMWLAGQIYDRPEYFASAIKAADFLVDAQMPDPQPAWSQQYNYQMEPIWARKFEPPAISGGESQVVIEALMDMAQATGETKYLAPIPKALAYLKTCVLSDGRLARFYELKTNKPLYFTRQYVLTYDDSDVPTHYGFKVDNKLNSLEKRFDKLKSLGGEQLRQDYQQQLAKRAKGSPTADTISKIISGMDSRGAWVEPGKLRYIKQAPAERPMILSQTFIKNLESLNRYIASDQKK